MDDSKLFRLKLRDAVLGVVVTVFTAGLIYLQTALGDPNFAWTNINWVALSQLSASAGIAYLLKNFLSNSDGFLGKI